MKMKFGFVVMIGIMLLLTPTVYGIRTNANHEWVIMFYLNGDNKLSSALRQTLNTIKSIGSTDDVHFAVLIDGNKEDDTKLYYIVGTSQEEQEWPTESDMSDPGTIVQFAEKVMNDYPASHYGLVITSNKGSGWQGVCWDDHGDGIMITMPEFFDALGDVTDNGVNKLDVLLIESCLCGNLELRYQVRSYCDYMLGYADCGLIGDIPYEEWLSALVDDSSMSPEAFATFMVDHFIPQDLPGYKIKQAFGATDSSKLDAVAASINELALFFMEDIDNYRDAIQLALADSRKYGTTWDIDYYIDLVHFLDLVAIDDPEFITVKNNVVASIDSAVIAKAVLEDDHSCGLNFYFPDEKGDYNSGLRYDDGLLPSPYEATQFTADTHWDEFLQTYLDILGNSAPYTPTITGPNRGSPGTEYEYLFVATDPDGDEVTYCIDWGENSGITCLGPYSSNEEITAHHIWEQNGTYSIQVRAKDESNAASDWGTLEVQMPKGKTDTGFTSITLLMGKITDLERTQNGGFRFLPVRVLTISYTPEDGPYIQIINETYGGYPCCGYMHTDEFHGIVTASRICGVWILK